ncbi:LPS export ABC transporter permease LptF [Kangiella sp. HZ709]|uniref:LPS export ABC transporter permease LptF n=1 Tax=Kangiella sp. HZ709 TaxID=2666328 RepID=UPI0012B0A139|nr:LPS export ABC transporter permease LptF [Kangiella sp. HZ709]MRX27302.1 LPS export ABC transporter permease LptF [Kangiella sp. HZ709]
MIISRYLNREVFTSTTAILGVLFAIFISQRIVKHLGQAANGDISGTMVWQMVGLFSPVLIGFLLPLAFFLGCLLAFSRLYVDSEMAVLRSSGVSEYRLIKMLLPIAFIVSIIGGIVTLWVAPWASETTYELRDEQASKLELSMLSPGQFQTFQKAKGVVYVDEASEDSQSALGNFFLAELPEDEQGESRLVSAKSAERFYDEEQDKNFLQLNDGYVYQLDENKQVRKITKFEHYYARLDAEQSITSRRKITAKPTIELWQDQDALSLAELNWRLAVPMSVPFLLLLAIPLSRVRPREGKFAKILPAIFVYIGYIIAIVVFRRWIEDGQIPGWVGYIPIYLTMALLAVRLLYLHSRANTHDNKSKKKSEVAS